MTMSASRSAKFLAAAAAFCMTASPALADGWGRYRHRHNGVDAGDVFAGLLIIGGIAAVAAAASNANKNKREARYPDSRYPDTRYPDNRYPSDDDYRDYRDYRDRSGRYGDPRDDDRYAGSEWRASGSMDRAVDTCVGEVERGDRRVDTVDGVNRDGDGWRVEGRMRDGREYGCTVGGDGRILRVTVGGQAII